MPTQIDRFAPGCQGLRNAATCCCSCRPAFQLEASVVAAYPREQKGHRLAEAIHLVVDKSDWRGFCSKMEDLHAEVRTSSTFAYIECPRTLRREAERLCRDFGLEDRVHFLENGEVAPPGVVSR